MISGAIYNDAYELLVSGVTYSSVHELFKTMSTFEFPCLPRIKSLIHGQMTDLDEVKDICDKLDCYYPPYRNQFLERHALQLNNSLGTFIRCQATDTLSITLSLLQTLIGQAIVGAAEQSRVQVEKYLCERYQFRSLTTARSTVLDHLYPLIEKEGLPVGDEGIFKLPESLSGEPDPELSIYKIIDHVIHLNLNQVLKTMLGEYPHLYLLVEAKKIMKTYRLIHTFDGETKEIESIFNQVLTTKTRVQIYTKI